MWNNIGLNYILQQLKIITPYGKEQLQLLKPYTIENFPILKRILEDLDLMINSLSLFPEVYEKIEGEFLRIKDVRGSIKRCENLQVLDDIEFYEIKLFAIYLESIRYHYQPMGLTIEGVNFQDLEPVIDLLDPEKKRFTTFSIYDAYSEELKLIREKKHSIENLIYIEKNISEMEVLKEQRFKLVEEEAYYEGKIRQQLSQQLLPYIERIKENIYSIGILDLCIGKAKLAKEKACTKPLFGEDIQLEIVEGRHPYIEDLLQQQDKKFTSISINLTAGSNAITGPNMGGKSVTIKTIALNALLGHMGFYVFANVLKLSVFNFIHLLSNDQESIKDGLSTFGGEIVKFNECMLDIKQSRGLVLIDEFARGTNPNEGRLLVKSLMEYLNKFDSISVFITHFDGVVGAGINHYQVMGLKHVDFNELMSKQNHYTSKDGLEKIHKLMDYRLEPVKNHDPVPKDALNISMLLGLDSNIIEIAKLHYHKEVQFYGEET